MEKLSIVILKLYLESVHNASLIKQTSYIKNPIRNSFRISYINLNIHFW